MSKWYYFAQEFCFIFAIAWYVKEWGKPRSEATESCFTLVNCWKALRNTWKPWVVSARWQQGWPNSFKNLGFRCWRSSWRQRKTQVRRCRRNCFEALSMHRILAKTSISPLLHSPCKTASMWNKGYNLIQWDIPLFFWNNVEIVEICFLFIVCSL